MNSSLREPRDEVVELHYLVVQVANYFLKQVSRFSIEELQEHDDPTYEDVARDSRLIAKVLKEISAIGIYSEERLAENALQAALFMERMAIAISSEDQSALDAASNDLQKMCRC